jgi:arylformamidase
MRFFFNKDQYIDTEKPIDISIPLSNTAENPRAWYVDLPVIEPIRTNDFIGSVAEGGSVNFRSISFSPHGHGTHTECLGHITPTVHSINKSLSSYFFTAELITVEPTFFINQKDGATDKIILKQHLLEKLQGKKTEALVIRTNPNPTDKKHLNYTETNPAYLSLNCIEVLNECGIDHLLIDLPSVDRELDDGQLEFHHAFWKIPADPQFHKTITELIYVPDAIQDGSYVLELQTAPFENDASPSRPLLYEITHLSKNELQKFSNE